MVSKAQYWAIKNSLTTKEKKLIDFYEIQWHLRQHVPTVDEVCNHLQLSHTTVNYYLQRKPVKDGLANRGIPYLSHTQSELTPTQVAVAVTMMNFADGRPNAEKLSEMGVNATQYNAWLNIPQFKNFIDMLSARNLKNIKPTAITEFTKMINRGDWQAIKYYLDVTNAAHDENATPQSEQLIKMFVEIIQRHVKDPGVVAAIANDLIKAANNKTIEAEVTNVEDIELDQAKKMLGVG